MCLQAAWVWETAQATVAWQLLIRLSGFNSYRRQNVRGKVDGPVDKDTAASMPTSTHKSTGVHL